MRRTIRQSHFVNGYIDRLREILTSKDTDKLEEYVADAKEQDAQALFATDPMGNTLMDELLNGSNPEQSAYAVREIFANQTFKNLGSLYEDRHGRNILCIAANKGKPAVTRAVLEEFNFPAYFDKLTSHKKQDPLLLAVISEDQANAIEFIKAYHRHYFISKPIDKESGLTVLQLLCLSGKFDEALMEHKICKQDQIAENREYAIELLTTFFHSKESKNNPDYEAIINICRTAFMNAEKRQDHALKESLAGLLSLTIPSDLFRPESAKPASAQAKEATR